MDLTISQSELSTAIQTVQRAVSTKNIIPILSGVLFETKNEFVDIYSTDLEMSVMYRLPAPSEQQDKTVLPARLLGDIVRNLPEGKIHISSGEKDGMAKITSGSSSFTVKTLPAEDFPSFPELETEQSITLDGDILSSGVKQVVKAVSKDETRPVLCGILINITSGLLRLVATDSYRLSIHEALVGSPAEVSMNVIVPARCLDEVAKICPGKSLTIGMAKNQIYFHLGNVIIVSRVIEGNFPPYQQLLPESHETRVRLNIGEFNAALKRVSLMAQNNALVRLKIEDEAVTINAMTADVGSAEEKIDAAAEGNGMEIAFNAQYLIDGLSSLSAEELYLELNNPLKPGILRPLEGKEFLYLVMPVRIG